MGRPGVPQRQPFFKRRPMTVLLAALVLTGLLFMGGKVIETSLDSAATGAVQRALGESGVVGGVDVVGASEVRLQEVSADGIHIDEVRLHLSAGEALSEGIASGVRRIELVNPQIEVETGSGGASIQELIRSALERVPSSVPGLDETGVEGASKVPPVHVENGSVRLGEEALLHGVDVSLTQDGGALRVDLQSAQVETSAGSWRVWGAYEKAPGEPGSLTLEGEPLPGTKTSWNAVAGVFLPENGPARIEGSVDLNGLSLDEFEFEAATATFDLVVPDTPGESPWEASVSVRAGPGRLFHHPFEALEGEATGGPGGWEIGSLRLDGAEGLQAQSHGRLDLDPGPELDLTVEVQGMPASQALRWVVGDDPALADVTGALDGRLRLHGPIASLDVSGEWASDWLRFDNASASELTGRFERRAGGALEAGASGEWGGGRFAMEVADWKPEGVSGSLRFDEVGAPSFARLAEAFGLDFPGLKSVRGRVGGRLELGGRPGALEVTGALEAKRLRFGDLHLEPFLLEGRWSPLGWEVSRFAALEDEEGPIVVGSAHGRGAEGEVDLEWARLTVDWLRRLLGDRVPPGLSGMTNGRLTAALGPAIQLRGEAHLDGAAGEVPIAGDLNGEALWGESWAVRGDVAAAEGSLAFEVSGDPAGAEARGTAAGFPAQVVSGLWRLFAAEGALTGDARWRWAPGDPWSLEGNLTSPELKALGLSVAGATLLLDFGPGTDRVCSSCLYGSASVSGDVAFSDREGDGDHVRLTAEFAGDEVRLLPVSVDVWGGRARIEGVARLEEDGWVVQVQTSGQNLAYRGSGLAADFEYQFNLAGPADHPRLSGEVSVSEGEVNLMELGVGRESTGAGGPGGGIEKLPVDFDVVFHLDKVQVEARSLLDGELSGTLNLIGSADRPALHGDLTVRRGSFWYLGSRFHVDEGRIGFTGAGLVPQLDVAGTLRRLGTRITAQVLGPADALSISLTSDPPMTQPEILQFIGVPAQWSADQSGGWRGLAETLASWVDQEVVSDVYWSLGSALEEAFDVDAFKIEPDGNGGTRLRIGHYVTPELYLSFDRDFSDDDANGWSLEYTLTPHVRLTSKWNSEEGSEIGIGAAFPF